MNFSITTLGCKVNQYDSAAIAASLRQAGGRLLSTPGESLSLADLVIINTCCVTATAMRKSRQAIRRGVRAARGAFVLVTGCYADYDPSAIASTLRRLGVGDDRAIIAGHHADLSGCLRQLAARWGSSGRPAGDAAALGQDVGAGGCGWDGTVSAGHSTAPATAASIKASRAAAVKRKAPGTRGLAPISQFPGHQRAFVKVQDGCDAFCSYCVVPFTRPIPWWRGIEDVEAECRGLLAAGHKEIVLCGVFLGAFGRETTRRDRWAGQPSLLPQLIRRVAAMEGLWRLRLSSLDCLDVTEELLSACAESPKVAPHFHLPLQSGSDRTLRAMNRQYTLDEFLSCLGRIRSRFDRPAITTDIIAGFPGESDEDFAATLAAAREARFARIHAFPFSPIPGTAAWLRRRDCPPSGVVKARMAELTALGRRLAGEYRRQFIGDRMEVLIETPPTGAKGFCTGMSDRYLPVRFPASGLRPGMLATVRIDRGGPNGLLGRLGGCARGVGSPAAAGFSGRHG